MELIKAGANVNQEDFHGCTPLFCAFDSEVGMELIRAGADMNHKDNTGNTALDYANVYDRRDVKFVLLKQKYLLETVRQWCRIFCTPDKFSSSALPVDSDSYDLK